MRPCNYTATAERVVLCPAQGKRCGPLVLMLPLYRQLVLGRRLLLLPVQLPLAGVPGQVGGLRRLPSVRRPQVWLCCSQVAVAPGHLLQRRVPTAVEQVGVLQWAWLPQRLLLRLHTRAIPGRRQ